MRRGATQSRRATDSAAGGIAASEVGGVPAAHAGAWAGRSGGVPTDALPRGGAAGHAGVGAARRGFVSIFVADGILRTAYQMGKTPALPIFAAMLGAGEFLLGLVVSVSTLTGILVKPLAGYFSDRHGRLAWLFAAAALFIALPFAYPFVETPEQLFALRLVHGLATAIFGPVSLAIVAEMAGRGRALRFGIFGMSRSLGYMLAPVAAAFLLTKMQPQTLFAITGGVAAIALLPLAIVGGASSAGAPRPGETRDEQETREARGKGGQGAWLGDLVSSLGAAARRPAIWIAGGIEMIVNVASYAIRAFLPVHIIAGGQGGSEILLAGLFFTVQEAAHMLARAPGGLAADRFGRVPVICAGMTVMAFALVTLPALDGGFVIVSAVFIGLAHGLVFPASQAFIADQTHRMMGTGMGLYGALRNLGKVAGPLAAGGIMLHAGFGVMATGLGVFMFAAAVAIGGLRLAVRAAPRNVR